MEHKKEREKFLFDKLRKLALKNFGILDGVFDEHMVYLVSRLAFFISMVYLVFLVGVRAGFSHSLGKRSAGWEKVRQRRLVRW